MSTQFDKELDELLRRVYEQGVVDEHGDVKEGDRVYPELAMQIGQAKEAIKKAVEVHIIGKPLTYTSLDLDAVNGSYDEAFEQGSEKTVAAQLKHLYGEDK